MNTIALVTGATSYLGARLTDRLLADGYVVHALMRPSSKSESLAKLDRRVSTHVHDGTTEHLLRIAQEVRPAIAFHLAGLFVAPHRPADVVPLIQSNVIFGTQLAEAMVAAGGRALVNVGTWWQHYGDAAYGPVALYAATKQAFQDVLDYYAAATPLRAITLKIFETYGEDDPRPKLFSTLAGLAADPRPIDFSPGDQPVDYVHISDVLDAFTLAGRRLLAADVEGHEKYAICTRQPRTLRQVVAEFERQAGRTFPIRWGARPHRPREMMVVPHVGEWLPGWSPRVSLEEGIARMLRARTAGSG